MTENLTLEEVETRIAEYTNLRKKLAKDQGKPTIQAVFAPLFRYPGITGASWMQYTPYFNDGEPCEFNVYSDIRLYADEVLEDDEGYDDGGFESYYIPDSLPDIYVRPEPDEYYTRIESWSGHNRMDQWEAYQIAEENRINTWRENGWTELQLRAFKEEVNKVEKWLASHEEFLEDVFGDHVKITVSKDGIEVDDYDHD